MANNTGVVGANGSESNQKATDFASGELQESLPSQLAQVSIDPSFAKDLAVYLAAATIAIENGRYKTDAHGIAAVGAARAGYLNQGSSAWYIHQMAAVEELLVGRSPAIQRFCDGLNSASTAIKLSDREIAAEDLEAALILDMESFEDRARELLRTNHDLEQDLETISLKLFDKLSQTGCYKKVLDQYQAAAASGKAPTFNDEMNSLSKLLLTTCSYLHAIWHSYALAHDDTQMSRISCRILTTSVMCNILKSVPEREMARDVTDAAWGIASQRLKIQYCGVADQNFRRALTQVSTQSEFLGDCLDSLTANETVASIAALADPNAFPLEEISHRNISARGALRIIYRLADAGDKFLALDVTGPGSMERLKIIEPLSQELRKQKESKELDPEAHYAQVLPGSSLHFREDGRVVNSLFSALSPVQISSQHDTQILANVVNTFRRIVDQLKQNEPDLFLCLRSDKYLTCMINQTNVVLLPAKELSDQIEVSIRGDYITLPLSETDLAQVAGGSGSTSVFVLPISIAGEEFEEPEARQLENAEDKSTAAVVEAIGQVPEAGIVHISVAKQFRSAMLKNYHTFREFLKVLEEQGAVLTSQGKGSHMAILLKGKIATVSERIRSETEPFKPYMAKHVLQDLGISLAQALEWM